MPVIDYRTPTTTAEGQEPDGDESRQERASINAQLIALGVIAAASALWLAGMKVLLFLTK